jgi:hypothetical protein
VKLFRCQACGQILHFENTRCENCSRALGYLPEIGLLSALEEAGHGRWKALLRPDRLYRHCQNATHDACNWLVPADHPERFCRACRHNRTIPDITRPENLSRWQRLELAKHRLFYTLMRLGLPLRDREEDPEHGLAFDFLENLPGPAGQRVMTGHATGVITIAIEEADDAERERMRVAMGESYRTLLGHFRHEVGHWYWDVLVQGGGEGTLAAFRDLFGDERADYAAALQGHYANGPAPDWRERFITSYASAHPWEDWAETWAHYLHMVDTLETAAAFRLRIRPRVAPGEVLSAEIDDDPHAPGQDLNEMVSDWMPLTFAVNSLNRSMGQPDLYPFVLSPLVIEKLGFVHRLVQGARGTTSQ